VSNCKKVPLHYPFSKALRLRSRRDYQRMVQSKSRYNGNKVIIDFKPNFLNSSRLGITVTRRYGKSHERNRFKRIVREAFRLKIPTLSCHLDIHVRPRSQAHSAIMQDIQQELEQALLNYLS
jgi:ribonuclease P protein component